MRNSSSVLDHIQIVYVEIGLSSRAPSDIRELTIDYYYNDRANEMRQLMRTPLAAVFCQGHLNSHKNPSPPDVYQPSDE